MLMKDPGEVQKLPWMDFPGALTNIMLIRVPGYYN